MSLERWGLSEADIPQLTGLARDFHQDFDLEGLSFGQALARRVGGLSVEERERLGDDLELALTKAPSPPEFNRLFVAAGAQNWPSEDDPRSELADWLSRQA